jgi:hypothetical protein
MLAPAAAWQRRYLHFLRNALHHLPRKAADDCLLNCAESTTGATSRKPRPTWPRGDATPPNCCQENTVTAQTQSVKRKPSYGTWPTNSGNVARLQAQGQKEAASFQRAV